MVNNGLSYTEYFTLGACKMQTAILLARLW